MKTYCFLICISVVILFQPTEMTSQKLCRTRDDPQFPSLIPDYLWNYWAGYYCYSYTKTERLKFKYSDLANYSMGDTFIMINKISNESFFTFDYTNYTTQSYLSKSFTKPYYFELWMECCREGKECCDRMTSETIHPNLEYPCPAIWDSWTCFDQTAANTIAEKTCSKQTSSTDSTVCELSSQKECFANGTWNQKTNYGTCAVAPVLRNRHSFNVIVLAIATGLSLPAVIIFYSLRNLRNKLGLVLHRNLILVIVIRNLFTIMSKQIIILNALNSTVSSSSVMGQNSVACRVLAFAENAAKNCMYACMLADGFYLHKVIVRIFAEEPSVMFLYTGVVILTLVPSLAWAIARGVHQGVDCWMVDESGDQWIIDGFRIGILVINFILLLDIIRFLIMMRYKPTGRSTNKRKSANLKATLFLFPLFGLHIILITNRNMVPDHTCKSEDIYYYISYFMEGLQGIAVATLFCYINLEVRNALKNAYRKLRLQLESRFNLNFKQNEDLQRRPTAGTYC